MRLVRGVAGQGTPAQPEARCHCLGQGRSAFRPSLFLIEAPDRAAVEAFNRADPFAIAGIWEKVTITGFLRRQG